MLPFLPVYLVVDCSASMHGAPLEAAAQSGDAEIVALWAGTSWRITQTASVATILDNLL